MSAEAGQGARTLPVQMFWVLSALAGGVLGFVMAVAAPAGGQAEPVIPLWLCVPFAILLGSIAVMPFVAGRFWHAHYPDVALFLGGFVLAFYLKAFGMPGAHEMLHAGAEYYAFIALVGGLYVASAGILVDIRDRATPLRNAALLGAGAVFANVLGTTGASVLLIRPYMRMNKGRLRPVHVVFFIFIVSNCGGCLTPIGDPPLYLGFLKGVPFFWTLTHLWPMWLLVNGLLLAIFTVIDSRIPAAVDTDAAHLHVFDPQDRSPLIAISPSTVCLLLLVAGVFVDPLLKRFCGIEGYPIGATFQIFMAALAYVLAKPSVRHANQFTFEPVKEVGFLFAGIFLTMAPALGYLRMHAAGLGLETPTQYYFATGVLSGALDNAPTYMSFLQVAMATLHIPLSPLGIADFIASTYQAAHAGPGGAPVRFQGQVLLEAIALGAVFFGAMTYIGNGPNFMVKAIVEAAHVQARRPDAAPGQKLLGTAMPSFFAYLGWACLILLPVLLVNWFVFIR